MTTSTLLDAVMPEFEFRGRVSIPVRSPAAALFRALREVRLEDMPIARLLGELRYLPARLFGRAPPRADGRSFVDSLLAAGQVVLGEKLDEELVIGNVGKLHRVLDQELLPMTDADQFFAFRDPEYEKLAIAFRIEDRAGERRLVLEHRTHALGAHARRLFGRYWVLVKPFGNFVSWLLLRAVRRRAETSAVEAEKTVPKR